LGVESDLGSGLIGYVGGIRVRLTRALDSASLSELRAAMLVDLIALYQAVSGIGGQDVL
jgi:hypothetical protein